MSIDLTTKYMGLELKNPLVVAACPLCGDADTLKRLGGSRRRRRRVARRCSKNRSCTMNRR